MTEEVLGEGCKKGATVDRRCGIGIDGCPPRLAWDRLALRLLQFRQLRVIWMHWARQSKAPPARSARCTQCCDDEGMEHDRSDDWQSGTELPTVVLQTAARGGLLWPYPPLRCYAARMEGSQAREQPSTCKMRPLPSRLTNDQ